METKTRTHFRQIGEWKFWHSTETLSLPGKNLKEAEERVTDWLQYFPREENWVGQNFGVPSLFLRMDCSILNGHLNLYKIKECPDKIGAMKIINPRFKATSEKLQRGWPNIKSLVTSYSDHSDDDLWLEEVNLEEAKKKPGLLFIRTKSGEEIPDLFKKWSVNPLETKGDKSYGLKMGLWREVSVNDLDRLNWKDGFCLRARKTSDLKNVEIWHPDKNKFQKHGISGFSTKIEVENALRENGSMYCQPFIMPMRSSTGLRMILQLYFIYNLQKMKYEYAGGTFVERPSIRIKREGDAVIGLVN